MLIYLTRFELLYQLRRPLTYISLVLFLFFGFMMGSMRYLPYADVYRNAAYSITYMVGILTLGLIFPVTVTVAQCLLKDKEAGFDSILYATAIGKKDYLLSQLAALFVTTLFILCVGTAGIVIGTYMPWLPACGRGPFNLLYFLWPVLVLAVPNILLCIAVTVSCAWLSKSVLSVYTAGLLLYILYIAASIFSNSPLMASASPASPETMALMAKMDPFGLAAFFEQTRYWTVEDRNTKVLALAHNFLVNRLLGLGLTISILSFAYRKFSFRKVKTSAPKIENQILASAHPVTSHTPVPVLPGSFAYLASSLWSLLKMDLRLVVQGVPFVLIMLMVTALLTMEMANAIDGGTRFAAHFANSSLLATAILEALPLVASLVLLFYSNELLWKAKSLNFLAIAVTSPVSNAGLYLAKYLALSVIALGMVVWSILVAIGMQVYFHYPLVDWQVYGSLFYYLGLPFLLLNVLLLFVQNLVSNKYLALLSGAGTLLLLCSKLGVALGLEHPLLRFANMIEVPLSEMSGFDHYRAAFAWQMGNEMALALVLLVFSFLLWNRSLGASLLQRWRKLKIKPSAAGVIGICVVVLFISSAYIVGQSEGDPVSISTEEKFDRRQAYEQKYKPYATLPQPSIAGVDAAIELYPSQHRYEVKGSYQLVNRQAVPLDSFLVYLDPNIQLSDLHINQAALRVDDQVNGHQVYRLRVPMMPGDTLKATFRFTSRWNPFHLHNPTNAILENGSFIRISRYFPSFGYELDNEIGNIQERQERGMPAREPLRKAEAEAVDPYQFTQLNTLISTEKGQTALGVGELLGTWSKNGREYFHYKTDRPVPFRFAVSSANYKVKRESFQNVVIEVYFDARHHQNIARVIQNAKATLAYGQANFGPYPHKTIRFAEISAFSTGFAATAYPTIIYAKEDQGFHADLRQADAPDMTNQLAGHELAHLWWGSAQVNPDIRQGHSLMTETLAQYTELMLYRKAMGFTRSLDLVKVHQDLYLSGRGYDPEMPLYQVDFESPHVAYNKGMVVMYQLEQLIGEARVNQALKQFFRKHAYPKPAPRSLDLLNCFYAVAPAAAHAKIAELFQQVITYDARAEAVSRWKRPDGVFETSFTASIRKYSTTGTGKKYSLAADPYLEVGVISADGSKVIKRFPVQGGKVAGTIATTKKPQLLVLDPLLKNIDVFPKDNEKAIP